MASVNSKAAWSLLQLQVPTMIAGAVTAQAPTMMPIVAGATLTLGLMAWWGQVREDKTKLMNSAPGYVLELATTFR